MSANLQESKDILAEIRTAIGAGNVLTDDADREFYAMDVYSFRELPLAVLQPGSVDELQQVARIASAAGVALVPRGGGASYTDAFLPSTPKSVLIDTERMNKVLEINEQDMYVTVEPGIYIAPDDDKADPAFRAIGVRIEDDVLITSEGHENLTSAIPKALLPRRFTRPRCLRSSPTRRWSTGFAVNPHDRSIHESTIRPYPCCWRRCA